MRFDVPKSCVFFQRAQSSRFTAFLVRAIRFSAWQTWIHIWDPMCLNENPTWRSGTRRQTYPNAIPKCRVFTVRDEENPACLVQFLELIERSRWPNGPKHEARGTKRHRCDPRVEKQDAHCASASNAWDFITIEGCLYPSIERILGNCARVC